MTAPSAPPSEPWEVYAPPLDPPNKPGLPSADAYLIAEEWWDDDPMYAAGLMWQRYAGILPFAPAVRSVTTGAQTVTYDPPTPQGAAGAQAKADWYFARSRHGQGGLTTVQLRRAEPDPWWWEHENEVWEPEEEAGA